MKNEHYILWLDDIRDPFLNSSYSNLIANVITYHGLQPTAVIWCKTYQKFVDTVTNSGLPDLVFFDNDLGENLEGYDCAKWLVDYCLDNDLLAPSFYCQSSNPPAVQNITELLNNYNEHWHKSHEQ